jgi:hypothetical protein
MSEVKPDSPMLRIIGFCAPVKPDTPEWCPADNKECKDCDMLVHMGGCAWGCGYTAKSLKETFEEM